MAGWAHPYVSHGSAGCSNGPSPVRDLAGLTDCLVGCQLVYDGLNWDEVGCGATMCVILWQALPGMSSWLWWRVKSKPQCAGALQASACIMLAETSLAQRQRVWQMADLKNWGNQPAIYSKERKSYKIIFTLFSASILWVVVLLQLC